jgi:hypothetical protein
MKSRLEQASRWKPEEEPEEPEEPSLPTPDPEQKPTIRVRYERDDYDDVSVVAIGDAHDSPRLPKDRFRWLGKYAADEKPDMLCQIGDMFTLDSLCKYDDNATVKGQQKPAFIEDMESGEIALSEFDDGMGNFVCDKHKTGGNHEDRIFSFTNRHPEIAGRGNTAGMMQLEYDRLMTKHGWSYSPFGLPHFIGGVAFIHAPMSIMGKPMGGENVVQNVTHKATHDWVFGHDHRKGVHRRPKLGVNNSVTAIDLGCALPEGHIEDYARISTTGWWYGAWTIRIAKGKIQSHSTITMAELEERYA